MNSSLIDDMLQANGEAKLARKPINQETGKEYDRCTYALFTGCNLGAYEPELVVKLYDSLKFQHDDTGIILMCCGFAAKKVANNSPDKSLSPKASERAGSDLGYATETNVVDTGTLFNSALLDVRFAWEDLGKPTLICPCPECIEVLNKELPEIPTVSLYEKLIEFGISGGCNSTDYCLWEECNDSCTSSDEAVRTLAEDMGVKIQPKPTLTEYEITNTSDNSSEELHQAPYITCNINVRNMLKSKGYDAVHILELIYGMGDSNTHLTHEHDHDNGHDHGDDYDDSHSDSHSDDHGDNHGMPEDNGSTDSEDYLSCDGNCSSCSGCANPISADPATLPNAEQRRANRTELKQALLDLFW